MFAIDELILYLKPKTKESFKIVAIQSFSAVNSTVEGRQLLLKNPEILRSLILLLQDESPEVAKEASSALINISADEDGSRALLIISEATKCTSEKEENSNLIHLCFSNIFDKESKLADPCCMILSNMTRPSTLVERIITLAEKTIFTWNLFLTVFRTINYNKAGAELDYLGQVLCNITQSRKIRNILFQNEQLIFRCLLTFVCFEKSTVRRAGIIGTLRNCCFDLDHHDVLMNPEIDIVSHLLIRLAGPEEFTDEENDKLPIDLQYLEKTKEREENSEIRIMLLESLSQLCATKKGREYLRENNAYLILRELHKWEKDRAASLACENVVDILIKTEEEIGLDNLKDVKVPEEYVEKFIEMDKLYLKDDEKEETVTNIIIE